MAIKAGRSRRRGAGFAAVWQDPSRVWQRELRTQALRDTLALLGAHPEMDPDSTVAREHVEALPSVRRFARKGAYIRREERIDALIADVVEWKVCEQAEAIAALGYQIEASPEFESLTWQAQRVLVMALCLMVRNGPNTVISLRYMCVALRAEGLWPTAGTGGVRTAYYEIKEKMANTIWVQIGKQERSHRWGAIFHAVAPLTRVLENERVDMSMYRLMPSTWDALDAYAAAARAAMPRLYWAAIARRAFAERRRDSHVKRAQRAEQAARSRSVLNVQSNANPNAAPVDDVANGVVQVDLVDVEKRAAPTASKRLNLIEMRLIGLVRWRTPLPMTI